MRNQKLGYKARVVLTVGKNIRVQFYVLNTVVKASFFYCKRQIPNMGLKSSTLLQEEDIEELQNETGCKYI